MRQWSWSIRVAIVRNDHRKYGIKTKIKVLQPLDLPDSEFTYMPPSETLASIRRKELKVSNTAPKMTTLVPLPSTPVQSGTRFWNYFDQRTSSQKCVMRRYTKDYDLAERLVSGITGKVLGMDLEWQPYGKQVTVDLIQICDENTILLIHTVDMNGIPHLTRLIQDDSHQP
jgi:hypothetical protein